MSDKIEVVVCMGSSCSALGNKDNLEQIKKYIGRNGISVNLKGSLCTGRCEDSPIVEVNGEVITNATAEKAIEVIEKYI